MANLNITIISLGLFGVVAFIILLTALFSPIPRKIGFRNIYRRFGNTILVVIGSLVGSALISGSLVLSDSLDKTFYNFVERAVGETDVTIELKEKTLFPEGISYMTEDEFKQVEKMLDIDEVDGVLPMLSMNVAPQKLDENGKPVINAYSVILVGVEMDKVEEFGVEHEEYVEITDNEALVSKPLADSLELSEGDTIRVPFGPISIDMEVKKIYEESGLMGGKKIAVTNDLLTSKIGLPKNSYSMMCVSAKGGIRPDDYKGEDFENKVKEAIKDFDSDNVELTTQELKQNALDGFGMKAFVTMFVVLSLFGIFSGILLIVNLYSMLAEERKMEMGILRAIVLTKFQLTKTFVYEGFIYSIISSLLGALAGLGIGYGLVHALGAMLKEMMSVSGDDQWFQIAFGFKFQSLATAFSIGFLITMITAIVSSYLISRLSIVSAIRNVKEIKEEKITIGWIIMTILNLLLALLGSASLLLYFRVRPILENIKDNGGDQNPIAKMLSGEFDDTVHLVKAHLLYFGFVITVFALAMLLNRLIRQFFKKNTKRIFITVASIINIVFTAFMTKFDSISKALEQDESIALTFISGVILVIAFALIITYNLGPIITVLNWLLSPLGKLRSVIRIALRYPAENRMRTGLTLVMFALVIFLIAYVSMVKATMNEEIKKVLKNSLGGYDLIIDPSRDVTQQQIDKFSKELEDLDNIEKVSVMTQTRIALPQYKYKDLEQADYWGDPNEIPFHNEEDSYKTFYNGLPDDFIRNTDIELKERLDKYETDDEAWEAVINDSSKVILGEAFVREGYGQQPDLELGQEIKVADIFEKKTMTKEVVGIVEPASEGSVQIGIYAYIITTLDHIRDEFDKEYLDSISANSVLLKFKDGVNITDQTNEVKKELMEYNISVILGVEDLTGTVLNVVDALLTMFQGFLAFSLIVGTSGLAIIITRAVHERRQQIGMLRSLGFQQWMVLASFFIESTFITLLGIVIGLSMGTIGALSAFDVAYKDSPDAVPIFPWGEIAVICLLVYVASFLFAILPSLKAARLSPVEATNYPE